MILVNCEQTVFLMNQLIEFTNPTDSFLEFNSTQSSSHSSHEEKIILKGLV